MANSYVEFSFAIEIDGNTYNDFATMMKALDYDSDVEFPQWYIDHEGIRSKDDLGGEYYQSDVDFEYKDGMLYVWNYGKDGVDIAVEALRAAMGNNNVTDPAIIGYSIRCDKPRTDAFGGGVVVVGPWITKREDSYDIGQRLCNEMLEEIKPANDSAPSMS